MRSWSLFIVYNLWIGDVNFINRREAACLRVIAFEFSLRNCPVSPFQYASIRFRDIPGIYSYIAEWIASLHLREGLQRDPCFRVRHRRLQTGRPLRNRAFPFELHSPFWNWIYYPIHFYLNNERKEVVSELHGCRLWGQLLRLNQKLRKCTHLVTQS